MVGQIGNFLSTISVSLNKSEVHFPSQIGNQGVMCTLPKMDNGFIYEGPSYYSIYFSTF